jgi:exosome complex component RRP4
MGADDDYHQNNNDAPLDDDRNEEPHEESRLVASTVGLVQRVNKLVSVIPLSERGGYTGQVGDLVVGRIIEVSSTRWTVQLGGGPTGEAALPLSGVYLPGGAQRMRTAQDARAMRFFLKEGDLVAAEIHKVPSGGSASGGAWQLHTRSSKYGKLENGCLVQVPPFLVPRRKQHVSTLNLSNLSAAASGDKNSHAATTISPVLIIFGCNGSIWLQRDLSGVVELQKEAAGSSGGPELVELHQQQQEIHAATSYALEDRRMLCRLSNSIQILVTAKVMCTVENLEILYQESQAYTPAQMLQPKVVVELARQLKERLQK